jgi:hypothetical protein
LQRGSRPRCDLSADFDRLGVRKPYTALAVRYVGAREDWVQAMGDICILFVDCDTPTTSLACIINTLHRALRGGCRNVNRAALGRSIAWP